MHEDIFMKNTKINFNSILHSHNACGFASHQRYRSIFVHYIPLTQFEKWVVSSEWGSTGFYFLFCTAPAAEFEYVFFSVLLHHNRSGFGSHLLSQKHFYFVESFQNGFKKNIPRKTHSIIQYCMQFPRAYYPFCNRQLQTEKWFSLCLFTLNYGIEKRIRSLLRANRY